jgi:hypothetical protein
LLFLSRIKKAYAAWGREVRVCEALMRKGSTNQEIGLTTLNLKQLMEGIYVEEAFWKPKRRWLLF